MQIQANDAASNISMKGSRNIFGISLIAAFAGFIFGFDTVVISGANLPIKDLWHTIALVSWFFYYVNGFVGYSCRCYIRRYTYQKYGRKKVLVLDWYFFQCFGLRLCIRAGSLYFFIFSVYWWFRYWCFFCSSAYLCF